MNKFLVPYLMISPLLFNAVSAVEAKPNILFLVADDQHRDQYNYLPEGVDNQGKHKNLTPNIDKLTSEGIIFDAQYCSTSVCTPSRFSILTGKYASRAKGVKKIDGQTMISWNTHINPGEQTVASRLQENGYFTGAVGKNHVIKVKEPHKIKISDNGHDPKVIDKLKENYAAVIAAYKKVGFDYAASIYHHNIPGLATKDLNVHNLDWITKGSLDFFDLAQRSKKPFFLYVGYTLPHGPFHNKASLANPLATPAGYLEKNLTVQPARETLAKRIREAGLGLDRCDMLWMDDSIGAMIKDLQQREMLGNTIIYFFNDHGVEAGKGSLYQGGALTQSWVWGKKFKGGRRVNALANNIDFAPTLLDLAGDQSPTKGMDGVSLLPVLTGSKESVQNSLYFEIGATRAVIKGKYKYIAFRVPETLQNMPENERKAIHDKYWNNSSKSEKQQRAKGDPQKRWTHIADTPGGRGSESPAIKHYFKNYFDSDQLYDIQGDPGETKNLAKDPEYSRIMKSMQAELRRHLHKVPGTYAELKTSEQLTNP